MVYFEMPEVAELEIVSAENKKRTIKLIVIVQLKSKAITYRVTHSIEGSVDFDEYDDAVETFNILQ